MSISSARCLAVVVLAFGIVAGACTSQTTSNEVVTWSIDGTDVVYTASDGRDGFQRTPLRQVGDLELPDYSADPPGALHEIVAEADGLLLVFFGYLSCPDVCPTTMADIGQAFEALPADLAERVEMAMVTVDLERDEGPQVADYAAVFVDRNRAYRAQDKASLDLTAEAFDVVYEIEEHEPGNTTYAVGHTAGVYVVDDSGAVVWDLPFGVEPDAIAATLKLIFEEAYG